MGESQVEVGKMAQDSAALTFAGVKSLERALQHAEQQNVAQYELDRIQIKLIRARKIACLKHLKLGKAEDEAFVAGLKDKTSVLSKLYVTQKVPQADRQNTKALFAQIKAVIDSDNHGKQLKDLSVPDHLICQISGEIMSDPVMITSGQTYERSIITRHFEIKKSQADQEKDELDEDEYDYDAYFKCPVTQQKVDPTKLLPNKRIKAAAEQFVRDNPWAYQFSPKEDVTKLTVSP